MAGFRKHSTWRGLSTRGLLFTLLFLLVANAWSHPDLLLQIDELTQRLAGDPDNTGFLLKRGDLHRRHEDWNLALVDFRRVREIQPDNEIVDWFEGRLAAESGQPEIGIKYLDRFLEANPEHTIALQNRAQAYLLTQQPLLAARDYLVVIRVSAKPGPSLYSAAALALVAAGAEYFSQAMGVLRVGLERFPGEVMLTGLGTDISLARSDADTARKLIETLPVSILRLPQWKTRVALRDCQAGRTAQAREWFVKAGENLPGSRASPVPLQKDHLVKLAAEPSATNCQAVALEILQGSNRKSVNQP